MTVVKICGLRELSHMITAADAGADLLGMVFLPTVRRYIEPEKAKELASNFRDQGHTQSLVGLFADQGIEDVNAVAEYVGLDMVQLCGNEPHRGYWTKVNVPIMKVVHVSSNLEQQPGGRPQLIKALSERLDSILHWGHSAVLDSQSDVQPGGLGETFDWSIARALANHGQRFLLAGGLTPENVREAIETTGAYGVDVSSGVETGGNKDISKIQTFITEAKRNSLV